MTAPHLTPHAECLCGDIELELSGDPVVQLYCHCDDCQRVHGAAYVPVALYRSANVTLTRGEPRVWRLRSSFRYSCGNCGTRLFTQGSDEFRGVNAYLLGEGAFRPSLHIYCKFAVLPLRDGLPHYLTVPALWGGSDETADWSSADGAAPPQR